MSINGSRSHVWFWLAGTVGLLALGGFLLFWWKVADRPDLTQNSFDGSSEALEQTVVVPTLDTPIPTNKSVIWCSSFQLAWNHLKLDVARGPIQLQNAEAIADRLNRAEQTEDDIDVQDYYAAAGFVKDGIIEKIQSEMRRNFPDTRPPAPDVPANGAVAYVRTDSTSFSAKVLQGPTAHRLVSWRWQPTAFAYLCIG